MTYPQPNSIAPVLAGQQSFRLKTLLASAGDIYESEASALAFAIGPNSDIATVQISNFDASAPGSVNTSIISPDRSLVGRIDARNDIVYPSNRRGRILISPSDIYDPRWRPSGFDASDVIQFETPVLDVIQYFVNPPSLIPQRSDKVFRYQYLTAPSGAPPQSSWIVIPAYGRKSGYFTFQNLDNADTVTVFLYGVKLGISASPAVASSFQIQLFTSALISGSAAIHEFVSSTDGLWDLFAIELRNYNGEAMPMTVTLSDDIA